MGLEGIMLSEISQTQRQILYDITDTWCLKNLQTSEYNKKEADSQIREQTSSYQRGEGSGRGHIKVQD